MIISVASGKGGTGKTTIATNLAATLGSPDYGAAVQLLDCDVEEPNAHLFLTPTITRSAPEYTPVPEVDKEKCDFCRKCAEICRYKAIVLVGKTVLTFPELCHSCGGCVYVCPQKAIREVGRELGVSESGDSRGVELVHGRLRIGEAMAPPLIKKVRVFSQPHKITIIDAPPGTSCPVITAIKGTDFVLMVTEPTPFGLHDLKLAVEAVKKLNIPHGLVINRADLGDKRVHEYANREKIPILMSLPFDRKIAEAYSEGQLIIDTLPSWKAKFIHLYDQIQRLATKGV